MAVQTKKAKDIGDRFGIKKFQDYPYLHAEIDAISKLWGKYYIDGSETLVVVRLHKNGKLAIAKPCVHCMPVLEALNIKKIYWTSEKGWSC